MATCPNPSSLCIEKVLIKNFRCFEGAFELTLNDGLNIIVGNNEAGKSTILEAINLALTGLLNGRYLKNELSQYIFNKAVVDEYIASLESSDPLQPPSVLIELYLKDEDSAYQKLRGTNNTQKADCCGIQLAIEFDEDYRGAYDELCKTDDVMSLPIEYYKVVWKSFDGDGVTARTIPLKSAFINSAAAQYSNGTDIYLSKIIRNALEDDEKVALSQCYREMMYNFDREDAVTELDTKFSNQIEISDKKVELYGYAGNANAWEKLLTVFLDQVPFQHVGKGEQCIVKTNLALSQQRAKKANLILIEEPENHLSHATLNKLLDFIKRKCTGKQIIITTHSSFVANKLGLDDLILLNNATTTTLKDLSTDTYEFFAKLPGYNTLRLLLAESAILVEGDCDELIVQKLYKQEHGCLPIEDGIDVISVALSYKRFLEIAQKVDKKVAALRDNDGRITSIEKNDKDFLKKNNDRQILFYDQKEYKGEMEGFNYNTLEPCLLRANSLKDLNSMLETDFKTDDDLLEYMNSNKTTCSLKIFDSERELKAPAYIAEAIEFVHGK